MTDARPLKDLAIEVAAFAVLVASVVLLWRQNLVLLLVALIECLLALWLWHSRFDLSMLVIIGGLGSLAEVVFVRAGIWQYNNPSLLGLPLWFPLAFGTTGMIGGRLAHTLTALWNAARPQGAPRQEPHV